MDNKKKQFGEVFYKVRYVLLFSMVLSIYLLIFSVNSYASVSIDTLNNALYRTVFTSLGQTQADNLPDVEINENLQIYLNNYDGILVAPNTSTRFFIVFTNSLYLSSGSIYVSSDYKKIAVNYNFSNQSYYFQYEDEIVQTSSYTYNNNLSFSLPVYNRKFDTIIYEPNIEVVDSVPPATLTLTALKSGEKFSFSDKNQLMVTTTGDINMHDYNYYVQRLVDNEWIYQTTSTTEYLILNGYENPWYVFFPNLNYFPVGIYRYVAGNDAETPVFVSNEFTIGTSVINNPITDNNGDNTGSIDTGSTVDNIKDYLGEEPDNANSDIENTVSDIQNNLENELENSDIITTLELAETGFLDLLRSPQRDFKIEWNNIMFMNSVLIPAGNINFSKMCRDNETLGKVKQYVNIILSFGIAIAIVKYLYNLFLATLGIDNQLLYEQNEDSTSFTADTSSGTVTYRTRTKNGNTIIHKGSMRGKESKG